MLTDQEFDALQEGDQCVFSAEALFDYDMANDDDVENQGAKDVKLECEQNVILAIPFVFSILAFHVIA